jgi:predicted DNA binding CopG/RHH family protein
MAKKLRSIPRFTNEAEEAEFWSTHESSEYIDWPRAVVNPPFPNLKQATKTITIRVSQSLLDSLKMIANKKDIPYQSLIKQILTDHLEQRSRRPERRQPAIRN